MATPNNPVVAAVAAEIEEQQELNEDIDEVSQQLAAHSAISETRHSEILGTVASCNSKLDQLSNQVSQLPGTMQQTDSPLLAQIVTTLSEIQAEQRTLRESLQALSQQTPKPSESSLQNGEVESPVPVIVPPISEAPPVKKRRVL